jgi:hypothetical protein
VNDPTEETVQPDEQPDETEPTEEPNEEQQAETDNTQKDDAFGQTAPDNQNNCANEDQGAAENEASEGGEQGEQVAIGEKQGENATQKAEEM